MRKYNEQLVILRSEISITDVIDKYAPRKISRHRCRCPVHNGKDNNFMIYDDTQTFYCFVCHAHGDIIELTKQLLNVGYKDAVEILSRDFFAIPINDISNSKKIQYKRKDDARRVKWEKRQKEISDTYDKYHEYIKAYAELENYIAEQESYLKSNAEKMAWQEVGQTSALIGRAFTMLQDVSLELDAIEIKIAKIEGRWIDNG